MSVLTGLDRLLLQGFEPLRGKRVAVLCNQASVDRKLNHIVDLLMPGHRSGSFGVEVVFGPQHGPYGHTQDNMVEWEGYRDARTGLPFRSLYGEHRRPPKGWLDGVDLLLVDLQDVGARYYTFIWTMTLCMEVCSEAGISVLVLDRPNPIGARTEGPGIEDGYESFVGLRSLPMRHGLTVGQIARKFAPESLDLAVMEMEGWSAEGPWGETGLPWVPPSPNMPSPGTALVYPGMCLLEGTNLSEGRGTARPFEWFGAPFLDSWQYAEKLNELNLPGVLFRPAPFQPTFQKHAGLFCGAAFIHILDPARFRPVLTGVAAIWTAKRLAPHDFAWKEPPYEYETRRMPIDILAGGPWLRNAVDSPVPWDELADSIPPRNTKV